MTQTARTRLSLMVISALAYSLRNALQLNSIEAAINSSQSRGGARRFIQSVREMASRRISLQLSEGKVLLRTDLA